MAIRKALATLMAASALAAVPSAVSYEPGGPTLEAEMRTLSQWKLHAQNQAGRKLEDFLRQNPGLDRKDYEMINYYTWPIAVDHFTISAEPVYSGSTVASAKEWLADESLWKRLSWKAYDQLPSDLRESILEKMFEKHGQFVGPENQLDSRALSTLPAPIIVANHLAKISSGVDRIYPDKNPQERRLVSDINKAIMLSESFAVHQHGDAAQPGKDQGLFQISPDTGRMLSREETFRGADFNDPDTSIEAGLVVYSRFLRALKNDYSGAIMAYNAGIPAAREKSPRARRYLESVMSRYDNYVHGRASPTWSFISGKAESAVLLKKPGNDIS